MATVQSSRAPSLQRIRAGTAVQIVDASAPRVMEQAGFGSAFKHGLGHGFGFQAINHAEAPVLHPASNAVLRGNGAQHGARRLP